MRTALFSLSLVLLLWPASASADHGGDHTTETGAAGTTGGIVVQGMEEGTGPDSQGPASSSTQSVTNETQATQVPPGKWVKTNACSTVGASGCVEEYTCPDGSPPQVWMYILDEGGFLGSYSQCPEDPPPTAETTPTQTVDIPAEVLNAFKRVALPQSTINVQPPGGETLVNLPTILSTSAERHQIPVRLERVNIDVLLEVWPSRFVWHHGDATSQETSEPGKVWTEGADLSDLITHTYATTSKGLDLSVDTTWSAQFRVVGQPTWRPVDGTVTIDGTPVTVAVLEAKPQLVR